MKFSIVTPVFNCKQYISQTIESVISQEGDFEIEYIIMDGGSTDGTLDVIKKYERDLADNIFERRCRNIAFSWKSEKDAGMYDAINKGFAGASGDIYAWINADDRYESGAFNAISRTFDTFPEVDWMKGTNKNVEYDDSFIKSAPLRIFHQEWLRAGLYGRAAYFVEQDSTFWRASLWHKCAPIPTKYKLAGDYWLWIQFAKHAKLWSINQALSIFRKRSDQLGQQMSVYQKEQTEIQPRLPYYSILVRIFFRLDGKFSRHFPQFFSALYRVLFMHNSTGEAYIGVTDGHYIRRDIFYYKLTPEKSD